MRSSRIWCDINDGVIYEKPLSGGRRSLYEVFGHGSVMPQLQNILIAVLALYCCFMVFKVSANAGFFLLPLRFILPPLVVKSRKKESGEEEAIWLGASCLSTSDQSQAENTLHNNSRYNDA